MPIPTNRTTRVSAVQRASETATGLATLLPLASANNVYTSRCARRLATLLLCLTTGTAFGQATGGRDARIAWLTANAAPIGSIDPSIPDDDFSDLEPIRRAVGNSRVVMLGEQSHGDGATFL